MIPRTARTKARLAGLALAFAAALPVGLAAAAPADAGTASGPGFSVNAPDQYLRLGCSNYPVTYSVTQAAEYGWSLSVTATGPSGGGGSAFSSGTAPRSGTLYLFLCDSLDPLGTYRVEVTYSRDLQDDIVATTSFKFAKHPSRVTIAASPTTVRTGHSITFSGRVTYLPKVGVSWSGVDRGAVSFQYQRKGETGWHTLSVPGVRTGSTGYYKATGKWPLTFSARVRAKMNESGTVAPSWSPSVWISRVK